MSELACDIKDVYLSRGARPILAGVSLQASPGEVVALMGESGSGKTTLLRAMAGLEPFERGAIVMDGVTIACGTPSAEMLRRLRRKVGMVFQFHCLFEHLTALQNVSLAPIYVHGVAPADADRRSRELLEELGVAHRAHALPRELSGGEAQRVAIARALATDPALLLMDEPTASLDPARRMELSTLLRSLAGSQRTLVVVTHDEDFAKETATRIERMRAGTLTG
ncbi:MAG: ATP-binding cassette domain-containing protein [Acidobacteriaceae bacterium]|jgi:ABC-type polar amino acid transport system ATPase subunit|nr:ATP-binding cassette domain-containing protein [Acidobacteriaceae bacterium]